MAVIGGGAVSATMAEAPVTGHVQFEEPELLRRAIHVIEAVLQRLKQDKLYEGAKSGLHQLANDLSELSKVLQPVDDINSIGTGGREIMR